ncbi:MAG: Sec-independent protein translocase subunit TatA/TatB [Paracoccaceae bacterium]
MFDFGFGELLLIGIVALVFLGEDLPKVFREMGRFTGKVRRMAREFSRAMEEAADEAGVKEAANTFKDAANPSKMGLNKLSEAADKFEKWDPTKPSEKAKNIGSETSRLSEERAEAARKIREYSTQKGNERLAAEAAEKAATEKAAAKTVVEPAPDAKDGA